MLEREKFAQEVELLEQERKRIVDHNLVRAPWGRENVGVTDALGNTATSSHEKTRTECDAPRRYGLQLCFSSYVLAFAAVCLDFRRRLR